MTTAPLWRFAPLDPDLVEEISRSLAVSRVTAAVLVARGASSVQAARSMLDGDVQIMHSPWLLPDVEKAVARLVEARKNGDRIVIYGDYDVDGQTGVATALIALRRLGYAVDYYLPHRLDEGYGLNREAIKMIAATGCRLLLTVDCGTNAREEVKLAAELGVDCLITDHHEPEEDVAAPLALINPKVGGGGYPFPHLAGVGVVYKLLSALAEALAVPDSLRDLLDLVALGTIADVVPLVDENRVMARLGLHFLNEAPRPAISALAAVSGCTPGSIDAYQVAFHIAPRLNAAGRMADAAAGVEIFLTASMEDAMRIACLLDQENTRRRAVEELVLADALAQAAKEDEGLPVVVAGDGWHPGVVGIVASRLVEECDRPAIVLSRQGDMATGSGRSVPGFHLTDQLGQCREFLLRYGGHAMAAGLTLPVAHLACFREKLGELWRRHISVTPYRREICVDACISPSELTMAMVGELNRLGPFGYGNPSPVLAWCGVEPLAVRHVGRDEAHLRLTLPAGRSQVGAIGFRLGKTALPSGPLDLVFSPGINEWQGERRLELRLRHIRAHHPENREGALALPAAPSQAPAEPVFIKEIPAAGAEAYISLLERRGDDILVWRAAGPETTGSGAPGAGAGGFAAVGRGRRFTCFPGGPLPPPLGRRPWLLVFQTPPIGEAWDLLLSHLRGSRPPLEVHFIYPPGEREALAALAADWPDREAMVRVYRYLRDGKGRTGVSEIAAHCGLSVLGARRALAVLQELGLLWEENGWPRLRPAPGVKLDLTMSLSYNESITRRRWGEDIITLREDCALIWKRLWPPTIPTAGSDILTAG
ncbi:MAG TPA: single-stranded-DNA-specific exonuclease RecJ [Firmicutes bacterium]|nr:single-stranded-DNA-specific exonuclease RecJ [Bacillota bacterium]